MFFKFWITVFSISSISFADPGPNYHLSENFDTSIKYDTLNECYNKVKIVSECSHLSRINHCQLYKG